MRDYTKPHPQAIFRDKPTDFIEIYHTYQKTDEADCLELIFLEQQLSFTENFSNKNYGMKTIALFIIKPKP